MKSVTKQHFRNKQGFIIMCDLSDTSSLQNVTDWVAEIYQKANYDDVSIMVLGNKCDMLERIDQTAVC